MSDERKKYEGASDTRLTERLLRERLRHTAQILIEEIGADGSMNAEEAAEKAVALIRQLKRERGV